VNRRGAAMAKLVQVTRGLQGGAIAIRERRSLTHGPRMAAGAASMAMASTADRGHDQAPGGRELSSWGRTCPPSTASPLSTAALRLDPGRQPQGLLCPDRGPRTWARGGQGPVMYKSPAPGQQAPHPGPADPATARGCRRELGVAQ